MIIIPILVSSFRLTIHFTLKKGKKVTFSSMRKYDKISRRRNKSLFSLDSGIYESSGYNDLSWNIDSYEPLVSKIEFDFYSSFDLLPKGRNKERDKKLIEQAFANTATSRALHACIVWYGRGRPAHNKKQNNTSEKVMQQSKPKYF